VTATMNRRLTLVVLTCCFAVPSMRAQCPGHAVSFTSETTTYACDPAAGVVPHLSWAFRLDCYDDCNTKWSELPVQSATADGACTLVPEYHCQPYYVQKDYTNGLYGTTNAMSRYVFGGCHDANLVVTQGDCPCAPSCTTSGDTSGPSGPEQNDPDPNGDIDYERGSPIVLSLEDGRFDLSSAEDPVLFDLLGTGDPALFSWTERGSDEAFLVLDRDGDGRIEGGRELFGDQSPQVPSAEPNGFRALAVFDDPMNGGNGDGWIDARDPIYEHLQLWNDANHDGVSQASELVDLEQGGVEALAVEYRTVGRRDPNGNLLRYQARVIRSVGAGAPVAWDVFFIRVGSAPGS